MKLHDLQPTIPEDAQLVMEYFKTDFHDFEFKWEDNIIWYRRDNNPAAPWINWVHAINDYLPIAQTWVRGGRRTDENGRAIY